MYGTDWVDAFGAHCEDHVASVLIVSQAAAGRMPASELVAHDAQPRFTRYDRG